MAIDSTSPIAPARVQVLLLPAGKISRARFLAFSDRLLPENTVRLGDVTPDPTTSSFSPLAFPKGIIFYNFTTSLPPPAHTALSPFETFREPLIVIGVVDGAEYTSNRAVTPGSETQNDQEPSLLSADVDDALSAIRSQVPRTLVVLPLLFEYDSNTTVLNLPRETVIIPQLERATTMKTVMADISSILLRELSLLARSIQVAPPLDLLYNAAHGLSTTQFTLSGPANVPLRTTSLNPGPAQLPTQSFSEGQRVTSAGRIPSANDVSIPMAGANGTQSELVSTPSRVDLSASSSSIDPSRSGIGVNGSHAEPTRQPIVEQHIHRPSESKKSNRMSQSLTSDFASSRLKARQSVIIGSLYLHAGRWPDALGQLVEGATKAKAFGDHLWHAKALENIMVVMLLLAWAGFEFNVPPICLATPSRSSSSKRASTISMNIANDVKPNDDSSNSDMFQILSASLPDLMVLVANTYARATNGQGEPPFQFAFSESIVRLSKLQTVIYHTGGVLSRLTVQNIIRGQSLPSPRSIRDRRADLSYRKHIQDFVLKGYPARSNTYNFSTSDNVIILCGIASVLASLGLERKEAFVNRQLLSMLGPALSQAQKASSTEFLGGVNLGSGTEDHLNVPSLENLDPGAMIQFLRLVCSQYGVSERYISEDGSAKQASDSGIIYDLIGQIVKEHNSQLIASQHMKVSVLRLCVATAEVMASKSELNAFIAAIFATVRPVFNPATGIMTVRYRLSREEQSDLAAKLGRTNDADDSQDALTSTAPYWDPFLLRGLEMQPPSLPNTLHTKQVSDFSLTGNTEQHPRMISGPFLHSAFPTATDKVEAQKVIAAHVKVEFVLSLQNLYDFDLEVEALTLFTEGVEFQQQSFSIVVGPTRMQRVIVSGIPLASGELKVRGCKATIKGCQEQTFLLFPAMWQPKLETKLQGYLAVTTSESIQPPLKDAGSSFLPESLISINVIERQPLLSISSTTLPQSSLALLEGEKCRFIVSVQNLSSSVSSDFVHISFQDLSTSPESNLEHRAKFQTPIKWCKPSEMETLVILPRSTCKFELEVTGVVGIIRTDVIIYYASLGKPFFETKSKFHTKQLTFSLDMSVSPCIEVFEMDVLPYASGDMLKEINPAVDPGSNWNNSDENEDDFVFLLFTFRNVWVAPLTVKLDLVQGLPTISQFGVKDCDEIHPGHTTHLIIPFRKLRSSGQPDSIEAPSTGRQKKATREVQNVQLDEESWVREVLQRQVKCTWKDPNSRSVGEIPLGEVYFTSNVVNRLRADAMKITMQISSLQGGDSEAGRPSNGRTVRHYFAKVGEALVLEVFLGNYTDRAVTPYIQLEAKLANSSTDAGDSMDGYIAWTGTPDRVCTRLKPGEDGRISIGASCLSAGIYEIRAVVTDALHMIGGKSNLIKSLEADRRLGCTWRTLVIQPG